MKRKNAGSGLMGQYEVHCVVCGAQLGFFEKGAKGECVPCSRCKRKLSFVVRDGHTVVKCMQARG